MATVALVICSEFTFGRSIGMTNRIISRADARAAGLTRYFTGRPCPAEHIAERFVSNKGCCECNDVAGRLRQPSLKTQERLRRREERAKQVHERKLAYAAAREEQAKARVEIAKAKEAAKVELKRIALERMKVARSLLLKSHEQKIDKRATRRRRNAEYRKHAPPPHERDCPPRPEDGKCQCCGLNRKFVLDHDHHTGEFRGWICDRCNRGIGALGDIPGGVAAGLEYLEKFYRDKPELWDTDFQSGAASELDEVGGTIGRAGAIGKTR
jgi:hypothetical protein